jgi:hypothetical protein
MPAGLKPSQALLKMPCNQLKKIQKISILVVPLLAGGCAALHSDYRDSPGAVQQVYQGGVPHTDARGRLRLEFDERHSFLPLGLYHALSGSYFGQSYDLATVRAASFNTIHSWELQPLEAVAAAAKANDLKLIFPGPSDEDVARHAQDAESPVLAWYLEQEPTKAVDDPEWRLRLERFQSRRRAVRQLDPARGVLVVDTPYITGPRAERWAAWNSAADISSHFNYPITSHPVLSLSGPRGIPETIGRALELSVQRRPIWLIVQAFASPRHGWTMPSAAQLRAMAYTAFVQGATGVIYFAFDSFVTRDDGVIGISPAPAADYGPTPDYNGDAAPHLVADQELRDRSRALWVAASRINGELADLRAELLTATSQRAYHVKIGGGRHLPVRMLLKERDGWATLFVVNLDNTSIPFRVGFGMPISPPLTLFESSGGVSKVAADGWADLLEPFAARVYRFSFIDP